MKGGFSDMKPQIANNVIDANLVTVMAEKILSPLAVVRNISLSYRIDREGKRTDIVENVRYDLVDTETYATFTVKVPGNKPIMSIEEFENTEELVIVELPLELAVVKAYDIFYGKAKVSIKMPYISLKNTSNMEK